MERAAKAHLSVDAVLDALSHRYRRILLTHLADEGPTVELGDLVATVAEREHDAPVHELAESEVGQIHLELHHLHLPKLSDHGLVTYEPGDDSATLERDARPVLEALDAIRRRTSSAKR